MYIYVGTKPQFKMAQAGVEDAQDSYAYECILQKRPIIYTIFCKRDIIYTVYMIVWNVEWYVYDRDMCIYMKETIFCKRYLFFMGAYES